MANELLEIGNARDLLRKLDDMLDRIQAEVSERDERIAALEAEVESLNEDNNDLEREVMSLESQIDGEDDE